MIAAPRSVAGLTIPPPLVRLISNALLSPLQRLLFGKRPVTSQPTKTNRRRPPSHSRSISASTDCPISIRCRRRCTTISIHARRTTWRDSTTACLHHKRRNRGLLLCILLCRYCVDVDVGAVWCWQLQHDCKCYGIKITHIDTNIQIIHIVNNQ